MKRRYTIKNGIFGKKLEDEYGYTFKPLGAKIKYFKSEKGDDIDLEIEMGGKRTPRLTAYKRSIELYSDEQSMFKVSGENMYVNVNFKNGEISPAFRSVVGSLCADGDKKVFRLEDDGSTTYSDYYAERGDDTLSYLNRAVVRNDSGKRGVIDERFHVVIPCVYDHEFSISALHYANPGVSVAKFDGQADLYYDGRKILSTPTKHNNYISESDKDLIYVFEDDDTRAFYTLKDGGAQRPGTIKEEIRGAKFVGGKVMAASKSGIWELGKESKKIYDCNVVDFMENEGEYFAVIEQDGKKGLYSLSQRKVVVEPLYDDIDQRYSAAKEGRYLVSKRVDGEIKWGVVDETGKELAPIEFTRPPFTIVESRTVNGRYADALIFNKKDEEDNTKIYSICLKAEEVVEEQKKTPRTYLAPKEDQKQSAPPSHGVVKSYDEKLGIALGASILFDSPIAGVIAMAMMDEDENSL